MTRIKILELVWDTWNIEHIKKHNVSQQEIVKSIENTLYHRRAHSGRYLSVGRAGKRIITVILRRQKLSTYYPVTARDANRKERKDVYEKESKSKNK